jgi:hypothetical protein
MEVNDDERTEQKVCGTMLCNTNNRIYKKTKTIYIKVADDEI